VTGRWRERAPAVLWGLLVLGLFADVLFLGRTFFVDDFSLYEYPQHLVTARALLEGRLPEWNDLVHLGLPHLANPTAAVFYPPTWLDLVDVVWALNARVALHVFLAGVGAWLLARRLGAGRAGAGVAALTFALGGPLLGYADNPFYQASGAWTPWVLAAFVAALDSRTPLRAALATGLALAAQVLAGDPQAALCSGVWMALLAGAWLAWPEASGQRLATRTARAARSGLVAVGTALGVAAVQWIPSALFLASSVRSAGAAGDEVLSVWSLPPGRLANLLVPHLFGSPLPVNSSWAAPWMSDGRFWFASLYLGALAVPLAALGLAERRGRGVALALAAFGLLAVGAHTPVLGALVRVVPPFGWFRFAEKYALHASLALAVLAGLGATRALRASGRGPVALLVPALVGALVAGLAASFRPWITAWSPVPNVDVALEALRVGGLQAGLVGAAGFVLVRLGRRGPDGLRVTRARLALLVVVAADLLLAHAPLLGTADRALLTREPSLAEVLKHDAGARPFRVFRDSALDRHPMHRDVDGLTVVMARNRATLGTSAAVQAGIEDVFGYTAALTSSRQALVDSLFRDLDAWTRRLDLAYLLVDGTRPAAKLEPWVRQGLLRELLVDPVTGVRAWRVERATSRVACERDGAPVGEGEACATVTQAPGHLEATVDLRAPATLVHGATLANGWHAAVDGVEAPLVPVYDVLQGVAVPAGAHRVTLTYRTPGLVPGAALSVVAIVGLAAGWAVARRRRRERACDPAAGPLAHPVPGDRAASARRAPPARA
jgi:hypothetical protein